MFFFSFLQSENMKLFKVKHPCRLIKRTILVLTFARSRYTTLAAPGRQKCTILDRQYKQKSDTIVNTSQCILAFIPLSTVLLTFDVFGVYFSSDTRWLKIGVSLEGLLLQLQLEFTFCGAQSQKERRGREVRISVTVRRCTFNMHVRFM